MPLGMFESPTHDAFPRLQRPDFLKRARELISAIVSELAYTLTFFAGVLWNGFELWWLATHYNRPKEKHL